MVAVPKTIDNDVTGTDITLGFDSARAIATEAVDRLHTTAASHHRLMVLEVMGRNTGWIALEAGIAGGGDVILIPEVAFGYEAVAAGIRHRVKRGRRFSIIVVAEGATCPGGGTVVRQLVKDSPEPVRLGGVGAVVAHALEALLPYEVRYVVLGHIQRGGPPTAFDRVLATRFGVAVIGAVSEGDAGCMVALRGPRIERVPLADSAGRRGLSIPRASASGWREVSAPSSATSPPDEGPRHDDLHPLVPRHRAGRHRTRGGKDRLAR